MTGIPERRASPRAGFVFWVAMAHAASDFDLSEAWPALLDELALITPSGRLASQALPLSSGTSVFVPTLTTPQTAGFDLFVKLAFANSSPE